MAYRHNDTLHKHQVKARRLRKIATVMVILFVLGVGYIFTDWIIGQFSGSNTVISKFNSTSVQSANVSVYRTEYFQFQAPKDWKSVVSESTDKKFVYLKNSDTQITQKLEIYVNRPKTDREANFNLTRVVPVDISTLGNLIKTGNVSDHCGESFPADGNRDPRRITHDEVSFVCNPDSQQYTILVGEKDGSEDLSVKLSDGREITLVIVFSDLTAYPNTGDLYNIISSFNVL